MSFEICSHFQNIYSPTQNNQISWEAEFIIQNYPGTMVDLETVNEKDPSRTLKYRLQQ